MTQQSATTDPAAATAIVRKHVHPALRVLATRPLQGGMINRVEEWVTDGDPARLVAKLHADLDADRFRNEYAMLAWYREHTAFPVPKPYACVVDAANGTGPCLLMERLPGVHLGAARLTPSGRRLFQQDLARYLVALHQRKHDTYGNGLGGEQHKRWLDWFAPRFESNVHDARSHLMSRSREIAADLLRRLDHWLPEFGEPTLIHGDLWAANIIVDDTDPDRPAISGFIDGNVLYADAEYELAYLRVFNTAAGPFFNDYWQHHPLRDGFEHRCRIYWLNTLLLHVWMFGDDYVPRCEHLIREIAALD